MKRTDLIRQILALGAKQVREGGNHTLYVSRTGAPIQVPRHKEIKERLAQKILRDAGA
jgi:predicted RNA binding protein YcfA (HicA-like mRNA interferase family)